jgi:hypothetical protein
MVPFQGDAKLALGYTLARDAADGRPAHIWTHGLLDESSTLYATAGILTHGCIANLDIREDKIPNPMFKEALALGNKVSPYFAGTKPLRWAALHYSENARNRYIGNPTDAWAKVLYPFYGAYLALLRARLPVGVVTDSQLEEGLLEGYKVMFLPDPTGLNQKMHKAISEFKSAGGTVIEQKNSWQWHKSHQAQEKAIKAFMLEIGSAVQKVPVQVAGGSTKMHAVSYFSKSKKQITVSLANDFSWVQTTKKLGIREGDSVLTKRPKALPLCTNVKLLIQEYGKPRRAFEAVRGVELSSESVGRGFEISVPDFSYMAVIVLEF